MLIEFNPILVKHKINVTGIIHIGAHWLQEYDYYLQYGIRDVIAIEPGKDAFRMLTNAFNGNDNVKLINCACGEEEGYFEMYTETSNQGQSNSLLKPKLHLKQHPEVIFNSKQNVLVKRLDSLEFERSKYNMLMMDVQCGELMVLKGAIETIKSLDVIYTECNRGETYSNCPLIEELDNFLIDFKRVETVWASKNLTWGDCCFVNKKYLNLGNDIRVGTRLN